MTRSLMPKGVEHMVSPCAAYCKSVVTRSLMPKGVEHYDDLQARLPLYGDSFVDAERR